MKKYAKKIITIVIVFVIISSFLMLNVFAAGVFEYDSCADHYFSEISGDDIPENAFGSCGYVATAMLLAFYDVYWNDNFVADIYEKNITYDSYTKEFGAGNLITENELLDLWYSEYLSEGGTLTRSEYFDQYYTGFASYYRNSTFLHLYLIGIGIENGYHIEYGPTESYGISISHSAEVLDTYFDNIFGDYRYYDPYNLNTTPESKPPIQINVLSSKDLGVSDKDVVDKMAELLEEGTPVMYRGEDEDGAGHRMIAYSIIEGNTLNKDDYNLHSGWCNLTDTTINTTKYDLDKAILWLDIDKTRIPHVCCDNYVEGDERYCSCQVYGSLHSEHIHQAGDYLVYSENSHVYKCKWGCEEPIEEMHTLMYNRLDSSGNHIYKCQCGYEIQGPHSFNSYTQISTGLNSKSYHYGICDCGYRELIEHSFRPMENPRYSRCTVCGYTRDEWVSGGSAVIMGKKEDDESE